MAKQQTLMEQLLIEVNLLYPQTLHGRTSSLTKCSAVRTSPRRADMLADWLPTQLWAQRAPVDRHRPAPRTSPSGMRMARQLPGWPSQPGWTSAAAWQHSIHMHAYLQARQQLISPWKGLQQNGCLWMVFNTTRSNHNSTSSADACSPCGNACWALLHSHHCLYLLATLASEMAWHDCAQINQPLTMVMRPSKA